MNLDLFCDAFGHPKRGLENAWHNQFVSWYQSSSCLENNLIQYGRMNLALGMGFFKHSPGMTQEAFGQEFDWFYFSFSPSLSRKWSGTVTYKIMKDLFDLLQEMLGNWLGGKFLSRKWGSLEWPLTILDISMGILFAHLHLLSSDSFSSLTFSLLLFSSLWPFPSLLFICPYCRKF